jgi:gliding motility-associated protein GldM
MKTSNPLRQKLINVMYLVLICMIVLNAPVDFIEAFTDLNRSLERSNYRMDKENERIVKTIERLSVSERNRYIGILNKLTRAKIVSDSAVNYIDSLKTEMISTSGGYSQYGHLVRGIDATLPTRKFLREGEGAKLKEMLTYTKAQLMDLLDEKERTLLDTVLIVADSIPKVKGVFYDWDKYYFDNVPLSAVIAMLSKFQNDIRLSESLVIKTYYDYVEQGYNMSYVADQSTRIDTFELEKGVKKFDVFNIGEDGVARVTLPSSGGGNPSANAVIYTYDDNNNIIDSFQFNNGVGEIKLKTDQIGEFKIKGFIRFRYPEKKDEKVAKDVKTLQEAPKDKVEDKKFEMEYKVVNPQPYISQKEYNVLFLSMNNPLNVYHPEHKPDKYRVTINNGKIIQGQDGYYARVNNPGYATVALEVPDGKGGYKKVAEEVFKVKEIPEPNVVLYNQVGGIMPSKIFKLQKGLEIDARNLEIDSKFRIVDYTVTYINGSGLGIFTEPVKGSYFSGKSKELIDLAQPGDIFVFDNISIKGPDGRNRKVDPIVFKIN